MGLCLSPNREQLNKIAFCIQQEASTAATRPLKFAKFLSLVIVFGKGSKFWMPSCKSYVR